MSHPIGWCTKTWNPITGCTPVSEACEHCYARRMAHRLKGRFGYPKDDPFRVTFHPGQLYKPFDWPGGQRVFVCSMGDLFHHEVRDEWILTVFGIMACLSEDVFLLLTKRPRRAAEFLNDSWLETRIHMSCYSQGLITSASTPLPNVWLGVTAENQARADERIPVLAQISVVGRFVSCEPLLGPIDLTPWLQSGSIDWVIAGKENGPHARHCKPEWLDDLREQAKRYNVPFFLKVLKGQSEFNEVPEVMTHALPCDSQT